MGDDAGGVATDWTRDEVFACVRTVVCRVLEVAPDDVTIDTGLDVLGADSLALIEMAELMEDEVAVRSPYRVRLDDVALCRARTVGDLDDELWRSLAAAAAAGAGARSLRPTAREREGAKGA